MKLIGLTGPAGSGKDTVARFLCDTQGFVQIALADPMRNGLSSMLNIPLDLFIDREAKEKIIPWIGKSPRELMQSCGDWMRSIHPNLLILLANRKIEYFRNAPHSCHIYGTVISDVRKDNEANFIRETGEIWHIHRTTTAYTGLVGDTRHHNTERGIEFQHGDRIIHNNGTIELLLDRVGELFTNEEAS